MKLAQLAFPALALAANGHAERSGEAIGPLPDLPKCQAEYIPLVDGPIPGDPLAIEAKFASIAVTDPTIMAVATLAGGTVCVDITWASQIENMEFLRSERFLGFDWYGYEAFGYMLIDRAGAGRVIDSGVRPIFSPGGKHLASLQVSEAGWGGMEGFAVWEVTPNDLDRIAEAGLDDEGVLPEIFRQEVADWRIDRWIGESCLAISAATRADLSEHENDDPRIPRQPYYAREDEGWEIRPGHCYKP